MKLVPDPSPNPEAETPPSPSLGSIATRGMAWLTLQSVGNRILSIVAQILLARLLLPDDYGLIALASGSIALVGALADFGIDQILVQRQRAMRLWHGIAFRMSLFLAVGLTLLCVASSPFFAWIYGESDLIGLICILSLAMPVGALSTLPVASLKMRLKFDLLAGVGFAEMVAVQALTVILAALGAGAYSFAIPIPLVAAVKTIVFWRIAPQPIGRRAMFGRWKHIFARGLSVVGSRTISTFTSQADLIVLGLVATADRTGLYFFAYRAAVQPLRMLAGSIAGVMQPALSRLNKEPATQTRAALNASRILAFLIMPTCFLQIAVAEPGLHLVFGERWIGAVGVVQLLSLGLAFDAVSWIAGSMILSQGRFHFAFLLSVIFSSSLVATVCLLNLPFSWARPEIGVATSLTLFYCVVQPLYSYAVYRGSGVTLGEILRLHFAPATLSAGSFSLAYWALGRGFPAQGDLFQIVFVTVFGGALYVGGLRLFFPEVLADILRRTASFMDGNARLARWRRGVRRYLPSAR